MYLIDKGCDKMELEDYQFTKQELKYLELLSEKYPTVQSVCTETVSYTHLDVYKRQVLNSRY